MEEKIDLHTHTSASDGTYSPGDLVRYARENGLTALAITDHDTVDGITEAVARGSQYGVRIIPGIEFSIDYPGGTFHLLGYYLDYKNKNLIWECRRLTRMRETRAYRIIDDLEKNSIKIPRADIEKDAKKGPIGRPHIARLLVKYRYAKNTNEVFENYLVKGKPGYVKKDRIDLDLAVSLIKDAGGIPVIAHPITLDFEDFGDFEDILRDCARSGISGVEVYSYMHSPGQIEAFSRISEKLDMIITGGSDFHGDKVQKIGNYSDNNAIPPELLIKMDRKVLK